MHRGAYRLIRAMNTAHPTARPTNSLLEFTDRPLNMLPSCLILLDRGNPTNPLVARERCQVVPFCKSFWIGSECRSQIRWNTVHRAGCDTFRFHKSAQLQIAAEGMGFEPMRPLARPSNFQACRLRPLGHPSRLKARPPKEGLSGSSAEGEGFEPSRSCPLRHFECRALGQPMRSLQVCIQLLAEGGGFEPPRGCPQRHFQCRALDRAMRSLRSYKARPRHSTDPRHSRLEAGPGRVRDGHSLRGHGQPPLGSKLRRALDASRP